MPKTKTGEKVYRKMLKEYGPKKVREVYYATEHKHPSWHKKKAKKR